MKLGIETTPTRRLLYQLGLLTGDGSAAAHLAWAKGKAREFDLISAQAQAAAFGGRVGEAVDLYQRARDLALARGLNGTASGFAVHIAWTDALYRAPKEAAANVKRLIGQDKADADVPGLPRFRAAAALGLVGLIAEAQALASGAETRYPDATLVRTLLTPSTRAAIALYRSRPDDAIEALRAASPTELGTVAGLVPVYLRGQAYLQKGAFADASRQYRADPAASRRRSVRADRATRATGHRARESPARRHRRQPPRIRGALHDLESCRRGLRTAAHGAQRV